MYDSDVQLPPAFVGKVNFEKFFLLVRPAFAENISRTHMDAVFKRASFLVNTKEHVYFRLAGINENSVKRISLFANDEYLTEDGKKAYGMFKAGDKDGFPEFEQDVRKEQERVKAVMEKRYSQRRENKEEVQKKAKIRFALFGEAPQKEESITEKIDKKEKQLIQVKREREEEAKEAVLKKARAWSCVRATAARCALARDPCHSTHPRKTLMTSRLKAAVPSQCSHSFSDFGLKL